MKERASPMIRFLSVVLLVSLLSCALGSHEKRGDGYFSRGRYRDALAEYLMAKRRNPRSADVLFKIGVTATRLQDLGTACAFYDTLLSVDSTKKQWIINDLFQFGVKSFGEGDTTSMKESFQMILDIDSTYNLGGSFYPLAHAYMESGQYDRASKAYLKALSYAPDSPAAVTSLFELARCYEQLGKYKEAIAYYDEYLAKSEGKPDQEGLWHRGSCAANLAAQLYKKGNFDEALEYLQMVTTLKQPQVLLIDAWFLTGEIYYAEHENEKALAAYNEVLKLDPAHAMKSSSRSLERIREIRYGNRK